VREEELPEVKRDLPEALRGCHCACLVTAHSVYKKAAWGEIARSMAHPLIVDGRNALSPRPASPEVITIGVGNAR